MIKPHGADILKPLFVENLEERNRLIEESASLPDLVLNSAAAANAVMLGAGYFSPLEGYMNLRDTQSVAERMRTDSGLFWPVPCVNRTDDISRIKEASVIALRDPNVEGNPVLAIQNIEAIETLNDREKTIVVERKLRDKPRTLDSIGGELGVSKERVRQLEAKAILKLRVMTTHQQAA